MSTNAINSIDVKLITRNAHNYKMLQNNSIRTMSVIIGPEIIYKL